MAWEITKDLGREILMGFAKKCDICGKFYDLYNHEYDKQKTNGFMLLNLDYNRKYYSHKPFDCCPECMDSIKEYIENLKTQSENNKPNIEEV